MLAEGPAEAVNEAVKKSEKIYCTNVDDLMDGQIMEWIVGWTVWTITGTGKEEEFKNRSTKDSDDHDWQEEEANMFYHE